MDIGRPNDYEQVNSEFDEIKEKILPQRNHSRAKES
jgi:hypothetical protein